MKELVHHEYAVGFPDGWTDRTEVVFAGPPRDGRHPSVTIRRIELQVEMTLAEFVAFQAQALEVMFGVTPLNTIEEGETTLGGMKAHQRLYRMRYANEWCVQRQYYAFNGRTAYVLTTTSSEANLADDGPVFQEIVDRFQLRPPPA